MKNLFFLIIALLCILFPKTGNAQEYTEDMDLQISDLCKQIVDNANSEAKLMVAITEFQPQGKVSGDFSKIITDEITAKLFRTKKFVMFDRSQLTKIASEQKIILQNSNSPEDIKNLGRITGANAILTGTISISESTIIIHSKLIGVANSNVISIATVTISKNPKKIFTDLEYQSLALDKVYSIPLSLKGMDLVTNALFRRISNNLMFEIIRIEKESKGILLCEIKISNINNCNEFELSIPAISTINDGSIRGEIDQGIGMKNKVKLDIFDGESEIISIRFKTTNNLDFFDNLNFDIINVGNPAYKIFIKLK